MRCLGAGKFCFSQLREGRADRGLLGRFEVGAKGRSVNQELNGIPDKNIVADREVDIKNR